MGKRKKLKKTKKAPNQAIIVSDPPFSEIKHLLSNKPLQWNPHRGPGRE